MAGSYSWTQGAISHPYGCECRKDPNYVFCNCQGAGGYFSGPLNPTEYIKQLAEEKVKLAKANDIAKKQAEKKAEKQAEEKNAENGSEAAAVNEYLNSLGTFDDSRFPIGEEYVRMFLFTEVVKRGVELLEECPDDWQGLMILLELE